MKKQQHQQQQQILRYCCCSRKVSIIIGIIVLYGCIFVYFLVSITSSSNDSTNNTKSSYNNNNNIIFNAYKNLISRTKTNSTISADIKNYHQSQQQQQQQVQQQNYNVQDVENEPRICPYISLHDVRKEQLHPTIQASPDRYIVDPPKDTNLSLICCTTTVGPLNILIHHAWAPLGAQRFLDMIEHYYFTTPTDTSSSVVSKDEDRDNKSTNNEQLIGVPFMRCIKNFLCQFGLGSKIQHKFDTTIQDDPNWLPEGPKYRQNDHGVKRYAKGYMAYAGSGNHSRNNQLIIALAPNGPLGGGSPWEVPFGEVIGDHSFTTLDAIYTGYDEAGPTQGLLWKYHKDPSRVTQQVQENFPKLDYITSCTIVDRSH